MKFFGKSKGFWGIAVTAAAWGAEKLLGLGILPLGVPEAVTTLVQAGGMLLALFGRWKASEPLSFLRR